MDGVLVIDKPPAKTSHDIVYMIRKSTGIKKVGHTGTLDPMATGVLVMLLGRATRIGRFLELEPKEYIAEAVFGLVTDSQDITGKILKETDGKIERNKLESIISEFTGEIYQIPPMFSAIKIGGRTLYRIARQGQEVERPQRRVSIYELDILDFSERDGRSHATFKVVCSGGTYVRTLIHDMGEKLDVGATLTALRRTRVGRFTLAEAMDTAALPDLSMVSHNIISMDDALSQLPWVIARNDVVSLILNGREIESGQFKAELKGAGAGQFVRVKSETGSLLAIGLIEYEDGLKIRPKIVLK